MVPPREIKALNWYRLYLQALFISDVSNVQGTHLDSQMYKGEVGHVKRSVTTVHHFVQERPSSRSWALWRKANLLWSTENGIFRQSLGPWRQSTSDHHRRAWPAHFADGILYTRMVNADNMYQVWTQEENKPQHYTIAGTTINIRNVPVTATPTETRRQFPIG